MGAAGVADGVAGEGGVDEIHPFVVNDEIASRGSLACRVRNESIDGRRICGDSSVMSSRCGDRRDAEPSQGAGGPELSRYWLLSGLLLLLFFGPLYGVVEALNVPLLSEFEFSLPGGTAGVAVVGIGFLSEALLTVPSTLVMMAHGAAESFWGPILSLLGRTGFAILGSRLVVGVACY